MKNETLMQETVKKISILNDVQQCEGVEYQT